MISSNLFIGTSGYYYKHWNYIFYPKGLKDKDKLQYYSNFFNTVEINNTHYKYPNEENILRWVNSVPEDFIFTFKAPKSITHAYTLLSRDDVLEKFFKPLEILKKNKHLILFQLPETSPVQFVNLNNLISKLPDTFRYAFEFRNESWFCDEVYERFKEKNIAVVLSDSPFIEGKYMWPKHNIETADFSYIRLHGPKELYASKYSKEIMKEYAYIINNKKSRGHDVFVYFNNDYHGYAINNVNSIKNFME